MSRVIDPSVAVKWYLVDEFSREADAVLRLVESGGAVVPSLFRWEVQNVLWRAHRTGRITEEGLDEAVDSLRALTIEVDDGNPRLLFGNELSLARACELSVYDAAYLALALDRNVPLATADERLAHAARDNSVTVEFI